MNAGKRLVAAMALISILPCLIIAFTISEQMQGYVHELQRKSLTSIAQVVSAHVYDFYDDQEVDSRLAVHLTIYRECLEARESGDPQAIAYWDQEVQGLFDETERLNNNIDGAALIDISGNVLIAYGKPQVGKNLSQTEMYRSIISGEPMFRSTVVNENGSRNIDMVAPVQAKDGRLIGMLKRTINLSSLNLYIDDVQIGNTGYVYLIDENATLLYHGSETKMDLAIGEFQDRSELDDLLTKMKNGTLKEEEGVIHYDNQGVDTIAAYSEVGDLGWTVVVAMDNGEMVGSADRATIAIATVSVLVGIIAAVACYYIVGVLLRPLTELKSRIREIAEGNHEARCTSLQSGELAPVMEAVNDIAIRLGQGVKELERAESRDTLTGMYDRRSALHFIEQQLYTESPKALLLVDVDDFDVINKSRGQLVGDSVLAEIGEKLLALPPCVSCCGRYEGDCFILLMDVDQEGMKPQDMALYLREEISQIRFVVNNPVHVAASVGIVFLDDPELELDIYLKHVEIALYKAKHSGKNTDVVFHDQM